MQARSARRSKIGSGRRTRGEERARPAAPRGPDAPSGTPPAIRARALTKAYGKQVAVDHLNLDIDQGETFGLLGPNGAGKTTTILMLLGLSEPTEGRAEVAGFDPTRFPLQVKRRVGYLPDEVGFYGGLTGRQNLRYTARLNRIEPGLAETRIGGLLEQVGLVSVADRPVDTYSRGMRQRLGIADALVKDPSVVVLDEPTTAIDPAGVAEVLALIGSIARDRGAAVLLSSHLLHQVQQVCDRVAIFVAGRVVAHGTPRRLAEQLAGDTLRLEVGVDAPADQVEPALRSLRGVQELTQDARDPRLWRVTGPRDLQSRLVEDLAGRGVRVWHLRRLGDDLDEIYMRYFGREEAGGGGAT